MPEQQPALNWEDLAQTRVGEVEPPKQLPVGHYGCVIRGAGEIDNKGKKKTLVITFPIRLTEALSDVDENDLADAGGLPDKDYELPFWLTPNSLYRFTEFGKSLGASDDMSVPEMAEHLATCGEAFCVEVTHDTDDTKTPPRTYMRIENPMPLADFQG